MPRVPNAASHERGTPPPRPGRIPTPTPAPIRWHRSTNTLSSGPDPARGQAGVCGPVTASPQARPSRGPSRGAERSPDSRVPKASKDVSQCTPNVPSRASPTASEPAMTGGHSTSAGRRVLTGTSPSLSVTHCSTCPVSAVTSRRHGRKVAVGRSAVTVQTPSDRAWIPPDFKRALCGKPLRLRAPSGSGATG